MKPCGSMCAERADIEPNRQLFIDDVPLLDVRAPVEFARGAFPTSVNRPIMTDAERHQVGIRYKQAGQEAAIALGQSFYTPAVKAERVAGWKAFAQAHPQGYLYCFRGGLRSRLTQQLLREEGGVDYPLIRGGYKAMRQLLLQELERMVAELDFVLVGGLTGSGKTDLIRTLPNAVDLEGLAHHRGSSFGRHATEQPAQTSYENALIIAMLKVEAAGHRTIVFEDEGHYIGRCSLPQALKPVMDRAPVAILETDDARRLEIATRDYVHQLLEEYRRLHPDESQAFAAFSQHLLEALDRVKKRLGGARHQVMRQQMEAALSALCGGDDGPFRQLIADMLQHYYDPMYHYQIERKQARVRLRGDFDQLVETLGAGQISST